MGANANAPARLQIAHGPAGRRSTALVDRACSSGFNAIFEGSVELA